MSQLASSFRGPSTSTPFSVTIAISYWGETSGRSQQHPSASRALGTGPAQAPVSQGSTGGR